MESAASLIEPTTITWKIQRDGSPVASVVTRSDPSGIVVATQVFGNASDAERIRPYRFPDLDAADSFVRDLVASFTYLGCQVARA